MWTDRVGVFVAEWSGDVPTDGERHTARAFADGKIGGPTRKSAKGGWTPEEVRI